MDSCLVWWRPKWWWNLARWDCGQGRTLRDTDLMCLYLRCWKKVIDDDTHLLKTCLLSTSAPSPPLSQQTNPPPPMASGLLATHPNPHSTHLLPRPVPCPLSLSLSLGGECKHPNRCRGHLKTHVVLYRQKALCFPVCVHACVALWSPTAEIITESSLGTAMCFGVMNTMGCFLCLCV